MGDEPNALLHGTKKYSKHSNILQIKQDFKSPSEFSFVLVDKDIILKEIKELDTKKVVQQDDIPGKILLSNNDIWSPYLSQIF